MTLEEFITYFEEQSKEHTNLVPYDVDEKYKRNCRQLAEWLKALKEIWDSGSCNDCRNGQCEWKPKLGQLVRFNCPHYVDVANGEVNADGKTKNT